MSMSKPKPNKKSEANKKPARSRRPRPAFSKINEEMKQWSAMLSDELQDWPQVTARPMFGMLGFYRGRKMFAAVPRTRALGAANAVIFKLRAPSSRQKNELLADSKVQWNPMAHAGWISFALLAGSDLNQALRWFSRAYQAAQ